MEMHRYHFLMCKTPRIRLGLTSNPIQFVIMVYTHFVQVLTELKSTEPTAI